MPSFANLCAKKCDPTMTYNYSQEKKNQRIFVSIMCHIKDDWDD